MTSQEHLVQMLRKRGPCEEQRQRQPFEWQRSLAPKITFGTKWIHSEIFFLERVSSHFDTFGKKLSSRNPVGILNAPTLFGILSLYRR